MNVPMKTYNFADLRPLSNSPKYPPYSNDLLEEYFFKYFIENLERFKKKTRTVIPVFWTNILVDNIQINVQEYLDALDQIKSYFTVVQSDDGVAYRLPPNTVVFEAGGNGRSGKRVPIPLIGSHMPNVQEPPISTSFLASFVGSRTHRIRFKIMDQFHNDNDFWFSSKDWNQVVKSDELELFKQITQASKFALCPRGYGKSSFRLYEVFQLSVVPVIITDELWLPWIDKIDWSEIAIIIHEKHIPDIKNILLSISEEKRQQMIQKGKEIYSKYFTLDTTCRMIETSL